jgi:hypothetical protein
MRSSIFQTAVLLLLITSSCKKYEPPHYPSCSDIESQLQPEQRTLSGQVFLDCKMTPAINKIVILNSTYALTDNNSYCSAFDTTKTDSNGNYFFAYNYYDSPEINDLFSLHLQFPHDSLDFGIHTDISSYNVVINDTFTIKFKCYFTFPLSANDTFYYSTFYSENRRYIIGPFPSLFVDTIRLTKTSFHNDDYETTYITYGIGWKQYSEAIGHITGSNNVQVNHYTCNPIDSVPIFIN